jgi:ribosomal protein S27E
MSEAFAARRRRRLLPIALGTGTRRPGEPEAVHGRCPGCGALVRVSPDAATGHRCAQCETPLIAGVGGLDIEQAVQSRLYRTLTSGTVEHRGPRRLDG